MTNSRFVEGSDYLAVIAARFQRELIEHLLMKKKRIDTAREIYELRRLKHTPKELRPEQ